MDRVEMKGRMARRGLTCMLLLVAAGFGSPVRANHADYRGISNTNFGEAYYVWQSGDLLQSMAMVMAADEQKRLGDDRLSAQLFVADNLSRLGLYRAAISVYDGVAKSEVKTVRNTALLESAKLRLALGEFGAALETVKKIGSGKSLDKEQQMEFSTITARVLLEEGKVNEAITALPKVSDESLWALYQLFDIGAELIDKYKNKNGALILHQIGRLDNSENEEMRAIEDKANLALGYSLLKINKPKSARAYLEKVRLKSHLSDIALLGIGWSYSSEQNYEKALVYWLELEGRPNRSAYGYETMLAIPYALSKAGGFKQAIEHYRAARQRIDRDISDLDKAKQKINSDIFARLVKARPQDESGWVSVWLANPESPENSFLTLLLDNVEYQSTLREYRSLVRLDSRLESIKSDIAQLELKLGNSRSGADIARLQMRRERLAEALAGLMSASMSALRQQAVGILSRYQVQLRSYAEQVRFGMAQAIESGTFKAEEGL
jgi:tetratricopeptide (TPR) repeat protein